MSRFRKFETEHQRLALLQVLAEASEYSHNETVLQEALLALGLAMSRDRLRTQLQWLAEQDLVELTDVAGLQVARLKAAGSDVARGLSKVPGVARARPRD